MAAPTQDFALIGFDHVDLRLQNREKARHFFVEQLGMDVIGEGPDHTFLLFGDQVLGLRDAAHGERALGIDHLAFRVEEWTGLRNRLKRARIEVTSEKERDDSRSLFLKGPEGLQVELVYRPNPHTHHPCQHGIAPPMPTPTESDDGDEVAPPRRRR
ncbi:MAG: VOC family protein [Thermoplasmata archaeon]